MDNINKISSAFARAKSLLSIDGMNGTMFSRHLIHAAERILSGSMRVLGYNDNSCMVAYNGQAYYIYYRWQEGKFITEKRSIWTFLKKVAEKFGRFKYLLYLCSIKQ